MVPFLANVQTTNTVADSPGTAPFRIYISSDSTTAFFRGKGWCTCGPAQDRGFACVADEHLTPEDHSRRAALCRLERRAEYRDFVGSAAGPTVVLSHAQRRHAYRQQQRHRIDKWRTRGLGKRPQRCALG